MRTPTKPVLRLAWLLLLLACVELGSRAYLSLSLGTSFARPRPLAVYYPELDAVRADPPRADVVDVLLLGGSVLDPRWSTIAERLEGLLAARLLRPVRVHDLAVEGRTTRDSRLVYEGLGDFRFDLVLVYHGINEARANNVPPGSFRDDYSHYSWYRYVNLAASDRWLPWLATPLAARRAWRKLEDRLGLSVVVPPFEPPEDWARFGADVRTAAPFRANLEAILDLARERGDLVLLTTFAIHVAAGYTFEDFVAGRLDYAAHKIPIMKWGEPANVAAAVAAHDEVVRKLAREHPEALFLDLDALLPRGRAWFDDVCHLTPAGDEAFVARVAEVVVPRLRDGG